MVDVGDKVRPPDVPSDGQGSWVNKVVGNLGGGMMRPECVLDDEFVTARITVEFPDGEDGEPLITIGQEVMDAMRSLWKRCMIVKVLGRNISIAVVSRKLRELWKPKGAMHVMDLPRHFFMVRFEEEDEYLSALTGGPWRVFGSYLMVQAWNPEFNPLRDEITTTPVWVRLSNIPVTLYHRPILMSIVRGLGKPIKVDLTTLNYERARFARVCVEVDLRKPLKGTIMINGERYGVSYEGLANICSMCGLYGHLVHSCPRKPREEERVVPTNHPAEGSQVGREAQVDDGFTVVRNGKKPAKAGAAMAGRRETVQGRNLRDITKGKDSENIVSSNSFGSLEADMADSVNHASGVITEANKENEFMGIQERGGKCGAKAKAVVFSVVQNLEKSPVGEAQKEQKRAGQNKNVEKIGPKSRVGKQVRPTRGISFGPTIAETKMSDSGKRLRVEKQSMGRAGGVFVGAASHRAVINSAKVDAVGDEVGGLSLGGISGLKDMVSHGSLDMQDQIITNA